jgi:hypothetical protein
LSESSFEDSSDPLLSHCDFDVHSFVLIAAGMLDAPLEVAIFGENTYKIKFVVMEGIHKFVLAITKVSPGGERISSASCRHDVRM